MQLTPGGFRLPTKPKTAACRAMAISALALGFPAAALGAGTRPAQPTASASARAGETPPRAADGAVGHSVLAFGSGYNSRSGSELVRVLQRDLAAGGYPAGHIDGLYGPRTQHAVLAFQAAHGLQVDGVVGPRTWAVLSAPVLSLGPGAGDQPGGKNVVRSLQRSLASAGDSPGPIDGRYGVLTEGAVRRFQHAHGLSVTGIAGPWTLAVAAKAEPSGRRVNPLPQKPATPTTRSTPTTRPTTSTAAPAPRERHSSAFRTVHRASAHRPRSGSVPWKLVLGCLALALVLVLVGRWLAGSVRRAPARSEPRLALPERVAEIHTNGHGAAAGATSIGDGANRRLTRGRPSHLPEPAETAGAFNLGRQFAGHGGVVEAHAANGHADQRDRGKAASNLGRLLEEQGALAEAEAAYRRADDLGDSDGAFHLGRLLEGQGGVVEAQAAYRRADERGHGGAALSLGRLLAEQGGLAEAEAAYRRADERGDADGAFGLGVLLAERGAVARAEAAFRRADERGDADGAFNLGVLLAERGALAEAEAAFRRADERGDAGGAFNLGAILRERGALDEAAAAYGRAAGRGHDAAALDLGILFVEHGALAEAEAAFRRADDRGDATAAFNLAVLLQERGALAEAEAAYRRAERRGDGEVADMARAALLDLGHELEESGVRGMRAQNA